MKFSILPRKMTTGYWFATVVAAMLIVFATLPFAELLYPQQVGRITLPYYTYPTYYKATANVVESFQGKAPQHFLDMYKKSKPLDIKSTKQHMQNFNVAVFSDWLNRMVGLGPIEHYATAAEFIKNKEADCTEYSVISMHTLASFGHQTSILLGFSITLGGGHAVTVVHIEGENYVLDINAFGNLIELNAWMKDQQFLPEHVLDKNGLHIYRGELYPV